MSDQPSRPNHLRDGTRSKSSTLSWCDLWRSDTRSRLRSEASKVGFGLPVMDPTREAEVVRRASTLARDKVRNEGLVRERDLA
jgi:hypothetical protein